MAAPQGVSVAFGADALATDIDWSRVDNRVDLAITGWSTKRGRTYLTDQTDTGTAQIDFSDNQGILDPTNTGGPFWPMDPNCPCAIALYNPVAATWTTIFTGLVQQIPQTLDVSKKVCRGSIMLADLFSLLALDEVPPGLAFDDSNAGTSTANDIGATTYSFQDVQSRILAILADAGIPSGLANIFSGNVNVQATVEDAGTKTLSVLQDAAEAEFPGIANLYIGKDGVINFRGRQARFDPTNPTYSINTWNVGDVQAVEADASLALISALSFDRDVAKVINAALVAPENILPGDVPNQVVVADDSGASIEKFGNRVYDAENLITAGGSHDGKNAIDETQLFGNFFAQNFHDAQTRITQLVIRWVPVGAPNDAAQWAFLCGVEIGDMVNVTTTHPGGGGFSAEPYFVEGISYSAAPSGHGDLADVTLTLDLSPEAYFNPEDNPFSGDT